jgi:hypothetical protein
VFSQSVKGIGSSSASGPDGDCRALVPYYHTNHMLVPYDRTTAQILELTRMLKGSNDELARVMKENERLTAENAIYAQVLEGCMEAQDTEQERNRAAAIEVANEWNADTSPFQTEPLQSSASSPRRKRTRCSSNLTEQQQVDKCLCGRVASVVCVPCGHLALWCVNVNLF